MDIKNLYVADVILPELIIGNRIEHATILRTRICKKEIVGNITKYIDLANNMGYSEK